MCIDAVVREITEGTERYDTAGTRAAQGTSYQPLIDEWLRHPFFQRATAEDDRTRDVRKHLCNGMFDSMP